ncbi:MAG: TetR/AcrR family transcriptional regulator [Caulobacterales bacterium]|nr:TetR/AcrR family transcriptional regulator [Caulobacterales bacterium]
MNALPPGEPKFRRRPDERPAEILAAALDVFSEHGFQATRMEEVARRAGVSKGAVYLYFPTKSELFQAVVQDAIVPNVETLKALVSQAPSFETAIRIGLPGLAERLLEDGRVTGVIKLIIAESRSHPELAELWHGTVIEPALSMMTGLIERAQGRGEVRAGDARYFAFGLMGPMLLTAIWRETFQPVGAQPIEPGLLAEQHLDTVLKGMRP